MTGDDFLKRVILWPALMLVLFALALGGLSVMARQAAAQQLPPTTPRMPCHNATEIAKQLSNKYDEAPVAFGLQSNGNLLQVYFSEEKDTWTVVSTTPAGVSCIIAAGKRWESLPALAGAPA